MVVLCWKVKTVSASISTRRGCPSALSTSLLLVVVFTQRRIHQLQRAEHVHFPRKEQVDFHLPAAGNGLHQPHSLHAVHGFFNRPRYRHQHLVDGRDAVIHADDDARKIRRRKHRHRNRARQIDAHRHQCHDDEDHRLGVPRRPMLAAVPRGVFLTRSPLTWAPPASPSPPTVTTCSPGFNPLKICTLSPSRTPVSILRTCATPSAPTTIACVPPSSAGRSATAGATTAFLMVFATIVTCTETPGLSRSPGLAISTQTCTVVLFGSTAGLTTITLPGTSSPVSGCLTVAAEPTFQ